MKKKTLLLSLLIGIMTVTCFAQDKDASEYMALAEKGDVEAQFNIGRCYAKEENYTEAAKWYMKAAKQNHADAQCILGNYYYNGWAEPDVPQDYAEAFKWYTKAAENGSTDAMMNIGDMYRDSIYVERDYKKAESYYMKAVNKGSSDAMIKMGDLYLFYYLYSPDIDCEKAAITWYNLAVDKGNPDAIAALAALYDRRYYYHPIAASSPGPTKLKDYEGDIPKYDNNSIVADVKIERDVPKYDNNSMAADANIERDDSLRNDTLKLYTERLWQSAAEKGSARAQAIIGFKCFLEKNFDKAMEWYAKAKKNGSRYVWRVVNVNLPIDMAIMLCEHFKNHSAEYDFYFENILAENDLEITYGSGIYYGWYLYVFPSVWAGPDGLNIYIPGDYIYVTITKNNKYGLIKLSKDGKLLEKTPIIYDSHFYYWDDDENGKFGTELNGQEVKFDL